MQMYAALVLAISFIPILRAESPSDSHRFLTIDLDTASFPVVDTFGDPTLSGGTQVWSPWFGSLIGDATQQTTIPVKQDPGATDPFTAYIYRRGCKVGYYEVKDLRDDSLHRKFRCEPAGQQPVSVTIQNFDVLNLGGLFARVSYAGLWRCYYTTPDSICSLQAVRFTIGVFPIGSDGRFTFPMPDFGHDPNLSRTIGVDLEGSVMSREATIDFVVGPLRGGSTFGHLVVGDAQSGRALRVAQGYASRLSLTFVAQR